MKKKAVSFDDMLAQNAKPATKKSKKKSDSYVSVPSRIAAAIRNFISCKKEMKELKSDITKHESELLDYFSSHHDSEAFAGKFKKSHKFAADSDNVITYVTSNVFSIATEDIGIVEEILSENGLTDLIEKKYEVKLRSEVFANEKLKKELMKLVGDRFAEFFETTVKPEISDNFDEKIYELGEDSLADLRTYAKQKKPSLR